MTLPSFAIACPNFHPRTCGVGDHTLRLATELRRRGHDVAIFTRTPAVAHPEAPDLEVHPVEGRIPLQIAEGIRRALVARRPSRVILQYTPEMWGAWRFGSPGTTWLAAGLRRAGIDVTMIAHELFTEFMARPDYLARAALQRAQLVAVARNVDRVLVTTETRVAVMQPYWRAAGHGDRPSVVRTGAGALPVPRVRKPGRIRLGLFSTLAGNKRFDVVLGAFEQVWRRRPEAELLLIGDLGPAANRRVAANQAAIDRHPARARIRVTGKLPLDEIAREIAELDVYLFPMTTGANTRSSTLPVALGSGVPCVATCGVETDRELFHDGDNVLFAESMTAEAFGRAALRIIDDPQLAERLSVGARKVYDEHLTWMKVVDGLLGALQPRA